jgi:hypothetical protein
MTDGVKITVGCNAGVCPTKELGSLVAVGVPPESTDGVGTGTVTTGMAPPQ